MEIDGKSVKFLGAIGQFNFTSKKYENEDVYWYIVVFLYDSHDTLPCQINQS